jgi:protoporphyrinogen/coproporphyrinogen III oxidase
MAGTVIVGAGVSGLATAYFLRERLGPDAPITVLEASGAVGGKVRTTLLAGLPVDTGPDAFLARASELAALVASLGLADSVVAPLGGGSYVWSRGRLRPLPPGTAFGLPERLVPLLRSGLLSPADTLRAGFDLVLPRTRLPADPSVAELVRPRFGPGVYDRLVSPLLGGVHAGDPALLSAQSTVPEIAAIARSGRSTYLTLRRRRRAAPAPSGPPPAPLVSLAGGMGRLVDALRGALGADVVETGVTAHSVVQHPDGSLRVATDTGEYAASRVVLATPAYTTADLLAGIAPEAAATLREIPYVDVANATLAFGPGQVPDLPRGTGFLVPPVEGELIVGCSWLSQKWPHLVGGEVVLVRSMVGRSGDRRWLSLSDDELVADVRSGLSRMLGITAPPVASLVQRWPAAMPQYTVGHQARLDRLDRQLAQVPGLSVTGAAYRGVGLAGCVAQAKATATRLVEEEVPA